MLADVHRLCRRDRHIGVIRSLQHLAVGGDANIVIENKANSASLVNAFPLRMCES
jgi:hypothetical protein